MFAKTIIDSDAFLDMPLSAQALYFHLSMRADDDGFVNNPKKIQRIINASDDDLKLLALKKFLIPFDSGIVVIKHWKIHNYIQNDRYKPTVYEDELAQLAIKDNKAYTLNKSMYPPCIQDVSKMDSQVRLGKVSIGKVSQGKDSIGKDSIDNTSCAEPNQVCSTPEIEYADVSPIPLNDGTEWKMPLELYEEYLKAYPALDVKQEISKMRIWSLSSPTNKKTKKGVTKFINNWLSKSQNNLSKYNKMNNGTNWGDIK